MPTSAYLDEDSEERARDLLRLKSYDSVSQVVREALKLMEQKYIEERLAEKYREEPPLKDEIESAQAETASELGDYPW